MPQSMLELQSQILELTAQVKVAMLQSTWEEFQYHLDIYCLTHGTHTERLLEKTWSLSLHVPSYFIVVTAPVN